ncbi:hypothetical protein B0H13DRAFT_2521080 [Mycena leptocephala]|nr:hypothetical protein B0H13DRAFT_2521080 [Mycena leptocephala]
MASRAGSPIDIDIDEENTAPLNDTPTTAPGSFSIAETNHALDLLLADTAAYLSGNGFKSKAFTDISASLEKQFPNRPIRKKDTVGNRLRYVKRIFEEYEFVRGKSGTGWDDEEKKASAEAEFIARFTEDHGEKYAKCFKHPCPYYDRLARLFGGNKATGAHVLHLKVKKPATSSSKLTSSRKREREPLANLENGGDIDIDPELIPHDDKPPAVASSSKPHDDELLSPPAKRSRTSHAAIDISDGEDDEKKTRPSKRDRSASGGSASSGRRVSRTAETGAQIARGLKSIGEGMSAPIVTKTDTSHVDEVVDVLAADPTLLPHDPEGELYALVLDALSANEKRARAFIKTTLRVHCIALLKRILTEQDVTLPVNWI